MVSTEKGNENSVANTEEAEQAVSLILPSVHHGMIQTHKKTTAMSEFSIRNFIKQVNIDPKLVKYCEHSL